MQIDQNKFQNHLQSVHPDASEVDPFLRFHTRARQVVWFELTSNDGGYELLILQTDYVAVNTVNTTS